MKKRDYCIDLWLEAEEMLRNDEDDECLKTKDKFMEEYKKLSKRDQTYVRDYLDQVGA